MNRREALAKATLTTSDATAGLPDPEQGRAFVRKLKEKTALANAMRQEVRTADSGELNKIATGSRIIRAATENADDGYRAGATFATVGYSTRKIRLPWEVTEDVFHGNIEGSGLEQTLTEEMTDQFALDMEDLEINGDTADAGADAAFLNINDGILKQIVTANVAGRNIDGSAIDAGVWGKGHMFEAMYAMPNVYRRSGNLKWIMSPARAINWWESVTNRATDAGDAALLGDGGMLNRPLGVSTLEVPSFPDNLVLLADPRNFVRVISWQIRKRRVTGETDATLAAKDKRFYVFFIKHDVIVEELDAVVRIHTLDPVYRSQLMPELVNRNPHGVRVTDENGDPHRLRAGQVKSVDGDAADRLLAVNGVETAEQDDRDKWDREYALSTGRTTDVTGGKMSLEAAMTAARVQARSVTTAVPLNQVVGDNDAPYGPPSGTITTKQAVARESWENKLAYADHERLPEEADDEGLSAIEREQAANKRTIEEVHEEVLQEAADQGNEVVKPSGKRRRRGASRAQDQSDESAS